MHNKIKQIECCECKGDEKIVALAVVYNLIKKEEDYICVDCFNKAMEFYKGLFTNKKSAFNQ